jgi:serine protease
LFLLPLVNMGGWTVAGVDLVDDDSDATDCEGHGTTTAGLAVGTLYGVATGATVHPVRVLACNGQGATSDVVAGLQWAVTSHLASHPTEPAVISMSLGGSRSRALTAAVEAAVAAYVTVVASAGNDGGDACDEGAVTTAAALRVGATTPTDALAAFSNGGAIRSLGGSFRRVQGGTSG